MQFIHFFLVQITFENNFFYHIIYFCIECHVIPFHEFKCVHVHTIYVYVVYNIYRKKATFDAKTNLHNQIVFHTFIF